MFQPPTVYGEVPFEVLQAIATMRERYSELLIEVGQLEVTKNRILSELDRIDRQSRSLLNQEAHRLGIPEGLSWQLTPEGLATASPEAKSP